ncbi:MAG TPA: GNAT family N-acetyltransferase [Thermomicrobiales bacterium]|nr:spermidine acetyltransferase [Chloroflexota bacterium]HCG29649.1 spermidine acetyltransferase [Chloroflexota bacterium]HQX62754.1 GNAT family N-acetyltransferase [Thermomicrobiales bacterium]HRA31926.1 GNAT family N-acetyltransferase [Thermomicrobiales bacterium]
MMTDRAPRVELRAVTRETLRQCIRLQVASTQAGFVASNVFSLAEAAVTPDTWPLAVYAGDEMVGFVMYSRDPETGRYWIMRLMVDAGQQGRGFGRATVVAAVELIRERHGCREIILGVTEGNKVAERLYESVGFHRTGEIDAGEAIMRLDLEQATTERQD